MRTKQVELPSGATAEIRRIGRVAGNRIQAMIQKVTPPAFRRFDLSNGLTEEQAEQLMQQIGEAAFEQFRGTLADSRVETVCACATIDGNKITPDTIDEYLDVDDFRVVENAIKELVQERESNTIPFSKAANDS